jgi:hypothetical protein
MSPASADPMISRYRLFAIVPAAVRLEPFRVFPAQKKLGRLAFQTRVFGYSNEKEISASVKRARERHICSD